jgi:hypothetical protein
MIAAFLVAVLALAAAVLGMRISGVLNPQMKSGVDRLDLIDRDDGSGPDESRWTPRANVRTGRRSRTLLPHPPHRVAPVGHGH